MDTKTEKWWQLHKHYNDIKKKYNLTTIDIYKQIGFEPYSSRLTYLDENNTNRIPAHRQGTCGRKIWDVLIANYKKMDWLPSNLTYEEKLEEFHYNNNDIYIYLKEGYDPEHPQMDIKINTNKYPHEYHERILTIDNIIPNIKEISYSYYL